MTMSLKFNVIKKINCPEIQDKVHSNPNLPFGTTGTLFKWLVKKFDFDFNDIVIESMTMSLNRAAAEYGILLRVCACATGTGTCRVRVRLAMSAKIIGVAFGWRCRRK